MSNLKPNNKWQIAYILMFAPFLVTIISHIFLGKARLDADTWQITEVLINYQGGFVRRGLIGEIIYQLSNNFGINTIFMVYLFSIASVVIFFYLIIKDTIKKGYSILLLPTAMLLSSLFVSGHWVRKDVFIMLLFYAIVRLLKNKSFINYIAINILLVIGTLSHEIILFIAAPILLISQLSHDNKRINIGKFVKGIATSVVCYFPALIAGILVAINKGNSATAQAIWDSWTCIGVFNSEIQGAIEGIGWTGEKAIEYGTVVWSTIRCGVYYPIMWSVLALSAFVIFVWMYKLKPQILGYKPYNDFDTQESAYIIILQFIAILPLLVVFADTSRLFFYVVMSAYIIRLFDDNNKYTSLFGKMPQYISKKMNTVEEYIINHKKSFIAFSFIIGLPSISVSALEHVVLHGQIGYFVKSILDLIKAL